MLRSGTRKSEDTVSEGTSTLSTSLIEDADAPTPAMQPLRGTDSLLPAVVQMLLFSYAGLVDVTFRLLNCVGVCMLLDGQGLCIEYQSVLFYAGGVECGLGWQWPLWLVLLLLVLLPAAPVSAWTLHWILPAYWRAHILARMHFVTSKPFVLIIHRITSQPFVESHWHWPAVLVLQRLLMVSVTVFINDEVGISVGVALVSLIGLVLQLQARPYRTTWVNTLQSIANTCLVTLAMLNYASGVFVAVGFDPSGTPLKGVQDNLDSLMISTAVLPPMFFLARVAVNKLRSRTLNQDHMAPDLSHQDLLTEDAFQPSRSSHCSVNGDTHEGESGCHNSTTAAQLREAMQLMEQEIRYLKMQAQQQRHTEVL
jgi:hypothetical protein